MKAMTVKDFDSLQQRDFENGAVRDSIRIALKERELVQQQPRKVGRGFVEKWAMLLRDYELAEDMYIDLSRMLKELGIETED